MQGVHLTNQGDKNDLLGQSHCADDQSEDESLAPEALLGQNVTGHGCGKAGDEHGCHRHEHGVDEPAESCGDGGAGDDQSAAQLHGVAEGGDLQCRDGEVKERGGALAHQALEVAYIPVGGEPDGGGGVYLCTGFESAGNDPVQGESEENSDDADSDNREYAVSFFSGFALVQTGLSIHIFTPPLLFLAQFELDCRQDSDDDGEDDTHCVAVAVLEQLEGVVIDVVHDGHGGVVGTTGGQQLDQCKALEGVDGGDDQNVESGGHHLGPLDLPEGLHGGGAVHLCCFNKGLVHIVQSGDIKNDGLAHGGGQQDEDDTAKCVLGIAEPVDVLLNQAHVGAQIIENTVIVIVHPLPDHGDGNGTGDNRQVEDAAEK